jgi:hypothetical protein
MDSRRRTDDVVDTRSIAEIRRSTRFYILERLRVIRLIEKLEREEVADMDFGLLQKGRLPAIPEKKPLFPLLFKSAQKNVSSTTDKKLEERKKPFRF